MHGPCYPHGAGMEPAPLPVPVTDALQNGMQSAPLPILQNILPTSLARLT